MKTKESGKPTWTDTRQLDAIANKLTEVIDQIVLNGDCGLQKTH